VTDVRLKEFSSLEGVTMDWLLKSTLELDDSDVLGTAVRVALGTDASADVNDILPDPDATDRRGWWGDMDAEEIWNGWPIGCKNWLLSRAKITDVPAYEGSTLERARIYTYNALQHFVDQGIASRVEVSAVRTDLQRIEVTATIYRGPLAEIELRYQMLWEEEVV
jgi:phage gp46-like protein